MASRPRTADLEPVRESDREGELLHPREQLQLHGHEEACRILADALRSAQLHHAWIIAGPKGVGKATLAWRFVRAVLAPECASDLAVSGTYPGLRQIAGLSHPDVMLLRRPWDFEKKRLKSEIPIEEVRKLRGFYSQHSTFGGARIAIIDCADDLSFQAQNALLKILEEPPNRALLLLISNAPGGLLATTRSRCRILMLRKLNDGAMRGAVESLRPGLRAEELELVSALADGAPGRALAFAESGAADMYHDIVATLNSLPKLDAARVFSLAEKTAKLPTESGIRLFSALIMQIEERLLRGALGVKDILAFESSLMSHLRKVLPLDGWARHWEQLRLERGRAEDLNLDKKQFVLSTFFALKSAAQR